MPILRTNSRFSFSFPTLIATAAIGLALAYSVFVAYPLAAGPRLTASWEQAENGEFTILGTAERVASVSIDELPIAITDQGTFSETRSYPPGYTVVTVHAEDRFGRSREQTLTLVNTHYVPYASEEKNSSEETISDNGDPKGN